MPSSGGPANGWHFACSAPGSNPTTGWRSPEYAGVSLQVRGNFSRLDPNAEDLDLIVEASGDDQGAIVANHADVAGSVDDVVGIVAKRILDEDLVTPRIDVPGRAVGGSQQDLAAFAGGAQPIAFGHDERLAVGQREADGLGTRLELLLDHVIRPNHRDLGRPVQIDHRSRRGDALPPASDHGVVEDLAREEDVAQ